MSPAIMFTLIIVGTLMLAINIPSVKASGTIYIRPDGSIDPETAPITTSDNSTYVLHENITTDISSDGLVIERNDCILDGANHVIRGTGAGNGITLANRSNVTIRCFGICNFASGIVVSNSCGNELSENNLSNNIRGIDFWNSSGNLFSHNMVKSSDEGIYIYFYSSNNTLISNTVTESDCGINLIDDSDYNILFSNRITGNNEGIALVHSLHCTLSQNTLENNQFGVVLTDPAYEKIFHNNFTNNTTQALVNLWCSPHVSWHDGFPSGGNYWSDYNGTDANHDGIGDSPFVIDEVNRDDYPLMGMFNSYNVTYYTQPLVPHACNVTVISNSTISDFVAPIWIEHPEVIFLLFNVNGAEGSTGFCRVSFPAAMMNGTYHVTVNSTEIPYTLISCSDANYSYLYFTYTHPTKEIIIIPELSSFLMPLLMIMTLSEAVYRKRHKPRTKSHYIQLPNSF